MDKSLVYHRLLGMAACSALFLAQPCMGEAQTIWPGIYVYHAQDGYDGGGTAATGFPVVLDLTLKIRSRADCALEADGFQTLVRLTCTVVDRPGDHGADIVFSAFDPKAVKECGFFDVGFHKGDVLLSLTPAAAGQGIMTHWVRLKPDTAKTPAGRFFTKGKN
jgi:hypothetical protein